MLTFQTHGSDDIEFMARGVVAARKNRKKEEKEEKVRMWLPIPSPPR